MLVGPRRWTHIIVARQKLRKSVLVFEGTPLSWLRRLDTSPMSSSVRARISDSWMAALGNEGTIIVVWLTHPFTAHYTHQKWLTMPSSLSIHRPPYLSCSSLMRNPFAWKYSAKESQDGSSLTNVLTSEKFIILPSLVQFCCDSLALNTSSWIQPSSASRKHLFFKWCSMLVCGLWQIKQWTSLEGFLHTSK